MNQTPNTSPTLAQLLDSLTDRQRLFCFAYVGECHCNATQAAIRAGFSEDSARAIASETLHRPGVRAVIQELLILSGCTPEAVKDTLGRHMGANVADFEPWLNGKKSLTELHAEGIDTGLVKSAKVKTVPMRSGATLTLREIELHDAQSAAVHLARLFGMIENRHKVEHSGSVDLVAGLRDLSDEELQRLIDATGDDPDSIGTAG